MRTAVSDGQEVYRVVVVKRGQEKNPDYRQGQPDRGPYYVYTDETYEASYGPYNSLGTAKAILTRNTSGRRNEPWPGVVGGRVEKAATVWSEVEL